MKISVLYFPHREGHNSVFPLLAFRKILNENGYKLHFYSNPTRFLQAEAEVVIVSGISLPKILKGTGLSNLDFLKKCRERHNRIIYLSGSDSTGPFDPKIIDLVDLFLNRQLMKDRSLYLEPHRRFHFRDHYFKTHQFKNVEDFPLVSYTPEQVGKLDLYWNLGWIDWTTQSSSKWKRYFQIYLRNGQFPVWKKGAELINRGYDLMFRGNLFPGSHDCSRLHRLQTYRIYRKFSNTWKTPPEGLVSHQKYMQEIEEVKICLSPFGWGEVCYRDFEAMSKGALLVKPSMDHLDTFPDFYKSSTYVSYAWDGSDLSQKIEAILANPGNFQKIADEGYQNFTQLAGGKLGEKLFINHFNYLIKKIT